MLQLGQQCRHLCRESSSSRVDSSEAQASSLTEPCASKHSQEIHSAEIISDRVNVMSTLVLTWVVNSFELLWQNEMGLTHTRIAERSTKLSENLSPGSSVEMIAEQK